MPTDRNLIKREVDVYADVLLKAAMGEDKVFAIGARLGAALEVIRGHMELRDALKDPTIPGEIRADIVRDLFKDEDPLLVSVLATMASRGDIPLLARVKDAYDMAAEKATDTIVVDVTTVVELDDELREAIKKKMSDDFGGAKIVLSEHIDKSIIGGVILGAHGKLIDASVRTQLERTRTQLATVPGGE